MVTSGTAINAVRVIYADATVADNTTGSNAAVLPASAEEGDTEKIKRRGIYFKLITDKYIRTKFSATVSGSAVGYIYFLYQDTSTQMIINSNGNYTLELDISDQSNIGNVWYIGTKVYSGTGVFTITNVEITVCGA